MTSPAADGRVRAALERLIERELDEPRSHEQVLAELSEQLPEHESLLRFLREKDSHHRHAFYVKSEGVWYRRFTWKIMRPLFVAAILGAVMFSLQRAIEPTLGFASFVLGGVIVYLSIQYFAHRWMDQDEKRLREVEASYRESLRQLREELRGPR